VQVLKKLENIKAKGVQLKLEREAAAGGASAVGKEGRLMGVLLACIISRVGQNHIYTVYIRYFWLGNHQIYSVYIRIYTVLANTNHFTCMCWVWKAGSSVWGENIWQYQGPEIRTII
jgi:hypothetical protein